MSKIKVGQIRKPKKEFINEPDGKLKIVISNKEKDEVCYLIFEDGTTIERVICDWVEEKTDLIAEYPTWQEAINSKEFNNG